MIVALAAAAVAALLVGVAAGVLAALYVTGRRGERRDAASGLTTSQVLDLIVLASASGIAVVDKHRDVVLANPRASELGLVTGGLLEDRAWAAAEEVLRTGTDAERDISIPRVRRAPDQPGTVVSGRSRISVRCLARPLSNDNGDFVVIFADDDSEQARMEATRRDFVANVSHELKTPVGAMGLLAEAMLESADDPDSVRHFGKRVLAESIRLGNMVSELIALSRLQGAEKLPDLDVVDVDSVVAEAVDRSRTAAEAADITVSTDRPSGLEVLGDQTLLVTALSNLVENAIAYSPKGSHVSVSRSLRGDRVAVAVTDRGIGIAPQDQQRVFERFFRVDKARSRSTGGTGLGLAIVKHVAANHNGEITLWSKLGTGSTFTLRVPVYQESEHNLSAGLVLAKPPVRIRNGPGPAPQRAPGSREVPPRNRPDETLSSVEATQ